MVALASGALLAGHHPVAPAAALGAFVLWCASVAWWPGIWLFVVPAALPLLNFAPWTGWVGVEEFDLLLLGAVAGGYARLALMRDSAARAMPVSPPVGAAFVGMALLFGLASVVSFGRGVSAAGGLSFEWFHGYSDPLNSWRVCKSAVFAALLWPLLRRAIRGDTESAARRLASGMLAGLTAVTLAVVWERAAYPGLWDFSNPYRAVALFWEIHVGGAAIDAYLALATPFVAWVLWTARSPLRWAAAAALALLTGYACLTTFSRGVYAAVVGSLVLLGLLLARQRVEADVRASALRALRIGALVLCAATGLALAFDVWGYAGAVLMLLGMGLAPFALKRWISPIRRRRAAAVALAFALALEVAIVLGLGTFMRERIATSDHDLGDRLAHWQRGLGLMQGPGDSALGIGLGQLPAAYARGVAGGEFPGDVQFVRSGPGQGTGWVRVLGPKTRSDLHGLLALTQRVALRPVRPYEVAFDVRAEAVADVVLQLCEMHLLYPRNCQQAFVRLPTGGPQWRRATVRLRGPVLDGGHAWAPRLGVFSVAVVNAGGVAEFDNFSLVAPDRTEALANRDFSEGLARWFPVAQGYYVPWHIDNLYLEVLIERGVPALLAFLMCMGLAVRRLVGCATPIAPFLAASLCAALCVGLVSSVMDVPRVAFLLFFLTLFAVELTGAEQARYSPALPKPNARSMP